MNKYLKVLLVNTLLFSILIFNFQNNISYGQTDNIDRLISITKKEEYLNKKIKDLDYMSKKNIKNNSLERIISLDSLKNSQIKLLKIYLETQLINCKKSKEFLITEIKQEANQNSNLTYSKGIWPLEDYRYISSGYGYRIHPISKKTSFHNGIDIPAPKNTSVLASDDGIVIFAGYKNGYGNVIEIEHFDNKKTLYAHNNSLEVNKGDIVKRGQVIAKVGSTGNSTGNHVHFEVKINNKRINPIDGISNDV